MKRIITVLLGAVLSSVAFTADVSDLSALEQYPGQHKVYLHTDKNTYLAGERIWFKAYVVDDILHRPIPENANLNVELINQDGEYVNKSLYPLEYGLAHGDIHLPDSMHEGNYILRAYTGWMTNFDEEFYFIRNLTIRNPIEENLICWRERRRNRRFNSKLENLKEEYQFAFFPEGGNLVTGLENRVAFKAADGVGAGIRASGTLKDDQQREIVDFETIHDGMGMFVFTPEEGRRYFAFVNFPDGKTDEFNLPVHKNEAYILRADQDNDSLIILVNVLSETVSNTGDLTVVAHTRGKTVYLGEVALENSVFETMLPLDKFPDGVTHITLFEENMAVAERLVFIYRDNYPDIRLDNSGDGIKLDFDIQGGTTGSYSLSAVKIFNGNFPAPQNNIVSYLLLTSDLAGPVYQPAFYLSSSNDARKAADLLMLTHGWRRFHWEEILENDLPEAEHDISKGVVIKGRVEAVSRDYNFSGTHVRLTTTTEGRRNYYTKTDREGNFRFEGLDYEGFITGEISLEAAAPPRAYTIHLKGQQLQKTELDKNFQTDFHLVTQKGEDWSRESRPDYLLRQEKSIQRKKERGIFGEPDQVVYIDGLRVNYSNMRELLSREVRGLRFMNDDIFLRGSVSIHSSNEPIFIIDDNTTNRATFLSLRPDELDRIEVLTGSGTTILGMRGAGGALIAYSKTSGHKPESFEFTIRGYSMPREFYESKIESLHYDRFNTPKTLWWEPSIVPGSDGIATLELPEEVNTDDVIILVEGINEEGNITYGIFRD